MERLISIKSVDDIPARHRRTPIGRLLEYHNLKKKVSHYDEPQLLIGMCMDNRKRLRIPDRFAFILRTGGANLSHHEFKVSYAIAVGNIRHVVLIGHTNCSMVDLHLRREQFILGLVEGAGWNRLDAEKHFDKYSPTFEINNAKDFVVSEAKRFNIKYPKIEIVPLMYRLEDNLLYMIDQEAYK
ncbi:MAG: carbonic anhydrase [Candidatus Omnitrophica bacterium]|nr:carbonic anhydrase [Candidatus Omnitrophota bacterium]